MSTEVYNGWTNYPTWNVKLWLDNDHALYLEAQNLVGAAREFAPFHDLVAEGVWSEADAIRFALADALKSWVEDDLAPDLGATFAADLFGWAMGAVNWQEIADNYLSEA